MSSSIYLEFGLNFARLSLGQDLQVTRDLKENGMKEGKGERKEEEEE